MTKLFEPYTLRNVTFRNRLWVAPMCMYSAVDGVVGDWHRVHLPRFAVGGAGLVIAEATGVNPAGRISPHCPGIWNDEQVEAWSEVVRLITLGGAVPGIQLAHAGRKASTYGPADGTHGTVPPREGGWQTVAPSAVAFRGLDAPRALTLVDIDQLVDDFAGAATRAIRAGFEVLEVHAAHGYLLHEFLSPLTNQRTDEYGGTLENRARLLLRVVRAVRDAAGERVPVLVRYSASDWVSDGLIPEDIAQVAAWAADAGADFADVSSGGAVADAVITTGPGYQVPFAETVHRVGRVPVGAVGEITTGSQAEQILSGGEVQAILAGREWLRDPHFGLRAAHELGEPVDLVPFQYQRAW